MIQGRIGASSVPQLQVDFGLQSYSVYAKINMWIFHRCSFSNNIYPPFTRSIVFLYCFLLSWGFPSIQDQIQDPRSYKKTLQELQMLSIVTLNCQVKMTRETPQAPFLSILIISDKIFGDCLLSSFTFDIYSGQVEHSQLQQKDLQ